MANTLDTSTTPPALGTSNPFTSSILCGTNSRLLVAILFVNGITARTGGAPTYNGQTMTDSGAGFIYYASGEAGVEIWYLINPPTGASYTVSIPNTNTVSMTVSLVSFIPSLGGYSFYSYISATGLSSAPSATVTTPGSGALLVGGLGSGERDIPSAGTNYTLLHTVDAGNQVWGSEYDLSSNSGSQTVDFALARSDDWALIGVCFEEITDTTDDLSANSIEAGSKTSASTPGQTHVLSSSSIEDASEITNSTLGQTHVLGSSSSTSGSNVGLPTLSSIDILDAISIKSNSIVGSSTISSNSVYLVNDANWFFSPGNWYISGSSYAITNNPGAYMKFRFTGTGIKMAINLTLFQATSPQAAYYPYLKWRVDAGTWSKQITTLNQTEFVFATGLTNTVHTIEIYFESIQRNIDRWINPSASIRFNNVTIVDGVLLSPVLRSERWVVFGDSRTEGVNTYGASYSNADQGAARSWGVQIGEFQDAEVGVIGWVSQGFNWPPPVFSNVPEFHSYDGTSISWTHIFNNTARDFTNIDTILVNIGVNDGDGGEAITRESIYEFLVAARTAAPSARIILLVPFFEDPTT